MIFIGYLHYKKKKKYSESKSTFRIDRESKQIFSLVKLCFVEWSTDMVTHQFNDKIILDINQLGFPSLHSTPHPPLPLSSISSYLQLSSISGE